MNEGFNRHIAAISLGWLPGSERCAYIVFTSARNNRYRKIGESSVEKELFNSVLWEHMKWYIIPSIFAEMSALDKNVKTIYSHTYIQIMEIKDNFSLHFSHLNFNVA